MTGYPEETAAVGLDPLNGLAQENDFVILKLSKC